MSELSRCNQWWGSCTWREYPFPHHSSLQSTISVPHHPHYLSVCTWRVWHLHLNDHVLPCLLGAMWLLDCLHVYINVVHVLIVARPVHIWQYINWTGKGEYGSSRLWSGRIWKWCYYAMWSGMTLTEERKRCVGGVTDVLLKLLTLPWWQLILYLAM